MVRTGAQYVESLKDGRQVYINGSKVDDVTTHPAFRNVVKTVAELYDIASDPANRGLMTYPSPATGEPVNKCFLMPFGYEDLVARREAIKRWADATYGFLGRSPDHVASLLMGLAAGSDVLSESGPHFAENAKSHYQYVRDNDLYVTYVIINPMIDRSKRPGEQAEPLLYAGIAGEDENGCVLRGCKMLGTATVISNELFVGNIAPLSPGEEDYAISCCVPVNASGLKVYSRRSYEESASSVFDYPLSSRFDENDALVVFDNVHVPWDRVFCYRNVEANNRIFHATFAHIYINTQAHIRFWAKVQFLAGLALKITETFGTHKLPSVLQDLGEIAAMVAAVEGIIRGSEANFRVLPSGAVIPDPKLMYGNMMFAQELYPKLVLILRRLCGGALIQLPSSVKDFFEPAIREDIDKYLSASGAEAVERVKLMKLAWDALGSEFGSRHLQYEMFYSGAPHVTHGHAFRSFDFDQCKAKVEQCMSGYDLEGIRDRMRSRA